ncbi:MAG: hydrogenase maturation factor [Butyrivibrio sp.]|nr:hydrogenase maturation factor [Butyrivibrio sp.]
MRLGKVTENVLKRSVLKPLTKQAYKGSAAVGTDCAFSIKEDGSVMLSATMPITFNSDLAGFLAVEGASNNILAMGGTPVMAVISILLPEDAEEPEIKKIMNSAMEAAQLYHMPISGGHTEVTSAVTRPVITVTVSGVADKDSFAKVKNAQAGDDLVMVGSAGIAGAAAFANDRAEELKSRYPAHMIEEAKEYNRYAIMASEAAVAIKSGVRAIHDISYGGVFAALWEMAEGAGTGLEVDLKKIPIRQETIEIAEFFEVNPYQLLTGGLLMAASDGIGLVNEYAKAGISAQIIGKLQSGNDRVLINEDEKRFLDLPQADEIHKVLG